MKRLGSISSILILFFAAQLWAGPWDQTLSLQTPEDKAVAFLKIRSLIPTMADGAVRYGFDPITLFGHQIQIESEMSQDPLYQKLKLRHKDLVEFTIYDGVSQTPSDSSKETSWKNWQERAAQLVSSLGLNSDQGITDEIDKVLDSPLLGKSQGIVVGVSNLIPTSIKKDFFSMSLENKIETLRQNLPLEIVSKGFTPGKLGWTDSSISKDEIITRLGHAINLEQRLTMLLIHHYSSIKHIADPKEYLKNLNLKPSHKKVLDQWFNSNVVKLMPSEQASSVPSLILREVPPLVSMFRGFAGNDCSTSHSFPFVNSPNEFTFLVYDSNGAIKGYAQGTRVSVYGSDSFYLHTIAGPRISTNDALNIIKTFVQEKQNFGFSNVFLPPMEQVEGLINFVPVRAAIKQVVTDSAVPLDYEDAVIRAKLKSTFKITSSYDDPGSNLFGYKINESLLGAPLKVEQKKSQPIESMPTQISKNSLVLMLLQMGKSYEKNRTIIHALVPYAEISPTVIESLIRFVTNSDKLPVSMFIEKVEHMFKDSSINFSDGYFDKNISLLSHGLIQSSDFLKNTDFAEKVLLNLLEQREISLVEKVLLENPVLFKKRNLVVSFLRSFYVDIHEAQKKEPRVLEAALKQNPQLILKNDELLKMLLKNAKAQSAINDFLTESPMWMPVISKGTGQSLWEAHKLRVTTLNSVLQVARNTKTEHEFIKVNSLAEIQKQGISLEEIRYIQNEIYIQLIDHYLSLQPRNSVFTVLSSLYSYAPKNDTAVRAMRKVLPVALKNASWELNSYLKMAAYLKLRSGTPEAVDNMVVDALGSATEKVRSNAEKYFPGLNWVQKKDRKSCESVFLF